MLKGTIRTFITVLLAGIFSISAFASKININDADVDSLAVGLDGVGPKIAQRIVEYREKNGPFENIEQLMDVRGIGEVILMKNQDELTIEASSD